VPGPRSNRVRCTRSPATTSVRSRRARPAAPGPVGRCHALVVTLALFDVEDVAPVTASREVSGLTPVGHFTGHPACTDRAVPSPPVQQDRCRSSPDAVRMVVEVSVSGQQVEVEAGQNVVPIHGHPRRSPVPAVLSPVVVMTGMLSRWTCLRQWTCLRTSACLRHLWAERFERRCPDGDAPTTSITFIARRSQRADPYSPHQTHNNC
jgi:hypothetical protein